MENSLNTTNQNNIQTPSPSSDTKYIVIILILLLMVLALAGYILISRAKQVLKPMPSLIVPTLTPTVTIATDDYAFWETYTNTPMSFSIKIPPGEAVTDNGIDLSTNYTSIKLDNVGLIIANNYSQKADPFFKKIVKTVSIELENGQTIELNLLQIGNSPFEKDGFSDQYEVALSKSDISSKYYVYAKLSSNHLEENFNMIAKILKTFKTL